MTSISHFCNPWRFSSQISVSVQSQCQIISWNLDCWLSSMPRHPSSWPQVRWGKVAVVINSINIWQGGMVLPRGQAHHDFWPTEKRNATTELLTDVWAPLQKQVTTHLVEVSPGPPEMSEHHLRWWISSNVPISWSLWIPCSVVHQERSSIPP